MILINISNHPSQNWDENQKSNFELILDFKFPNIPPTATTEEVKKIGDELLKSVFESLKTLNIFEDMNNVYFYIAGEFTLSYYIYSQLSNNFKIIIPTTDRVVEEKINEKGEVEKISKFKFVMWRECIK